MPQKYVNKEGRRMWTEEESRETNHCNWEQPPPSCQGLRLLFRCCVAFSSLCLFSKAVARWRTMLKQGLFVCLAMITASSISTDHMFLLKCISTSVHQTRLWLWGHDGDWYPLSFGHWTLSARIVANIFVKRSSYLATQSGVVKNWASF